VIADPTAEPVAVRIETAARLLDASPAMVRFWIKTGRLRATKVGRSWRVRTSDLNAMVEPVGGKL
jgi:excisionase family DNA binding protein